MLKHCSKSDIRTKINYQQPRYLFYYCHLCENNKKKIDILSNETGSPVMRITLHQKVHAS